MPYTEFHYTPTGTGAISGKEVLEQTEDAINDLGGQISGDVQTAIDTANNALNTANTASADAQNAVNTANTAYTAATNAQNTANTAQNTASNALTAAQNAQNDVNALGNRVTTAEGNITQNTNAITGLTTRMGTAEGNITTLQNDVITAQATATSAQQTATTARQQSYVFRYSSTALVASSTNSNALLDNTDNLKVGDKVIDSSGVLFSITAVDTQNSTFTIGTALIDLAQDSDVVHKSGNETISGNKTFVNSQYFKDNNVQYFGIDFSKGTPPSAYTARCTYFSPLTGGGSTYQTSNGLIGCAVNNNNEVSAYMHAIKNTAGATTRTSFVLYYNTDNDKRSVTTNGDFLPMLSGQGIGNSTNKWATINGLNPSSLGMPDLSNGIDISSYLTAGNSNNTYTPPANGWISISLGRASSAIAIFIEQGDMKVNSYCETGKYQDTDVSCFACLPVVAGVEVNIGLKGSGNYINSAKFFPCQGNV